MALVVRRIEAWWAPWSGPGVDHVVVADAPGGGHEADGVAVVGGESGDVVRVRYRVGVDAGWRTRTVDLERLEPGGGRLTLRCDGEGTWTGADGEPRPDLDGCVDVDLSITPFTNTLPVRRLEPTVGPGRRATITAAWVDVEALTVRPDTQHYTRLLSGVWRFEDPAFDFSAVLGVDQNGLVTRYPGLFRRLRAPRRA